VSKEFIMIRVPPIRPLGVAVLALALAGGVGPLRAATPPAQVPFVRLHTAQGDLLLVLFPDLAPHHVATFLHLARAGFYDQTTFHRIVPGFVIQGGDPLSKDFDPRNDGSGGPTLADVLDPEALAKVTQAQQAVAAQGFVDPGPQARAYLKAEFSPTAKHLRGSVSMARAGGNDDSAGSQFFICLAPCPQLDGQYTIFGQVITGMAVADTIAAGATLPSISQHAAKPVAITACDVLMGVDSLTADQKTAYEQALADLAAGGSHW
jgi:cyclophilin family peptidyl-prolyl cis-trans isomerase